MYFYFVIRKVKEKEKNKEKYESEIRGLERENREFDAEIDNLGEKITAAKVNTKKATESYAAEKQNTEQKK